MKMNREQLRALGLTEEQIDAVVADHARVVQGVQTRLTAAENKAKDLESQLDEATNSKEVQTLTKRAEEAETKATALQGQLDQITIDNAVNEALTTAGATDLEYARFKLGEVTLTKDGKVKDLENKVKDLQTQIPTYFQTKEEGNKQGENTSPADPLDGFQRIGAKPGEGDNVGPNQAQSMIDAMTADLPTQK